uniref:Uncharacterized protein n=1 Tax=Marseillevirus LCMAC201 TaxID=2506605 RepID=A0A481YVU8_9VIRU|nr:MAG: hypothetical protein LCMAC201_02040 [Marseillevirus LCMAC201]
MTPKDIIASHTYEETTYAQQLYFTFILSENMKKIPYGRTRGSFVFAFTDDNKLVFTNHPDRGYDLGGGKMDEEDNNDAVNCAIREFNEETESQEIVRSTMTRIGIGSFVNLGSTSTKFPDSVYKFEYFYGQVKRAKITRKTKQDSKGELIATLEEARELKKVKQHQLFFDAAVKMHREMCLKSKCETSTTFDDPTNYYNLLRDLPNSS